MATNQPSPRLGALWITGMAELNDMIIFISTCPKHRASLLEIERHLHTLDNTTTLPKVRDRADMAGEAGLMEVSQNDVCTITPGGVAYAKLISAASQGSNALPGAARTLLRRLWKERLEQTGRLYTNLQQMILALVEQGGHQGRVRNPGQHLSATPDDITATLQCLDDFGLLKTVTESGYQLSLDGLVMAGVLGLITGPPEAMSDAIGDDQLRPTDPDSVPDLLEGLLNERLKPMVVSQLELQYQFTTVVDDLSKLRAKVAGGVHEERLTDLIHRISAMESAHAADVAEQVATLRHDVEHKLQVLDDAVKGHAEATATFEAILERLGPTSAATLPEPPLILVKSHANCRPVPSERALLEDAYKRLNEAGYRLELKELANLWTCTKAGQLTILAGPPGSGKSSVVRMLAEALGHRSTLLEVPVRRGWTDDQDFMGGINRLHERYEPAVTGVIPHLIAADRDPSTGLYWLLLDEFNLSTPEYYFAEFISVLEADVRQLSLYREGTPLRNAGTYSARISVGPNVHFFGTVNLDDTASPLSPRLIDRANVLWIDRQIGPEALKTAPVKPPAVGPISFAETLARFTRQTEFTGPTRAWWDTLQRILTIRDKQCGRPALISPRSMVGVARYCANAPREILEPREAFDLAMAQRVLPGLRGFGEAFGERLRRLEKWATGEQFTRSAELLHRIMETGGETHEYDFLTGMW